MMTVVLMTESHSTSAQSHSPSRYFSVQTSYVFRAESSRMPWVKANFLRIFPGKVRSGCFMFWERLETFVRCAFAHSDRSGHGASLGEQSQSQCESLDRSGVGRVRMDDWLNSTCSAPTALWSIQWVVQSLSSILNSFWACLVGIDTTDKPHGKRCRAWQSLERKTQREREISGSAGSSSVEVQGPQSRCQVLPEEVQKLDFLAFLSLFKPKVLREILSRSLRFLSAQGLVMSAAGTRGIGSEHILSSVRFWSFFAGSFFK